MTRLIAAISTTSGPRMIAEALAALGSGADVVELRLDALDSDPATLLQQVGDLPAGRWLATYRTVSEGGQGTLPSDAVQGFLETALRAGGLVDVEAASGLADPIGRSAATAQSVIVSRHDFEGRPPDLDRILEEDGALVGGSVGKLAWQCQEATDNLAACELMRARDDGRIVIPMGEKGLPSRVLARKFGAWGTFCGATAGTSTAPGQVTLSDMIDLYRWESLSEGTAVFGVIGSPVSHSMSPALFNALFTATGEDAVYLPWRVDSREELAALLRGCRERPWFGATGFSVTIPHKGAALELADEVEPLARRIGAANTLHLSDGRVGAFNTDYQGALAAIESGLGISPAEVGKLAVNVLGAGGVARAVVAGLCDRGAAVTIYNRSEERGVELAREFGCMSGGWDVRGCGGADLVINCTSIGMSPDCDFTPLPEDALAARPAVFDTVYNPMETMMLKQAKAAGCRVVDGVAMFVAQAAAQYRLWTGGEPDTALMSRIVRSRLAGQAE